MPTGHQQRATPRSALSLIVPEQFRQSPGQALPVLPAAAQMRLFPNVAVRLVFDLLFVWLASAQVVAAQPRSGLEMKVHGVVCMQHLDLV